MTRIEIKAHCPDPDRTEAILASLGAGPTGRFSQVDYCYCLSDGRLIIRKNGPGDGVILYYVRAMSREPSRSDSTSVAIGDPEIMIRIFSSIVGKAVEVEKTRKVWIRDNVTANIDDVFGLGMFVELAATSEEWCVKDNIERIRTLMLAMQIPKDAIVAKSYSDLIAALPHLPSLNKATPSP